MLSTKTKNSIKEAFFKGTILVKSADKKGNVEYKKITDVHKHFCFHKKVFKIELKNKKIITTEDHSLYEFVNNQNLKEIKSSLDLKQIVVLYDNKCKNEQIVSVRQLKNKEFMYDLSVEDNENFFLTSGILAHNSFSAPSKEGTIAGFTRTRGYRWTDDSLYMHLVQACNYLNLIPPDTSFDLISVPAPWQPLLLTQAMSYALYDLAILWINEEFTYNLNGYSLDIVRSDKYMSVAQTLQSQVDSQMTEAKRRLHYTIGLRQSKYTMSYGGFFGPFTSGRMSIKKWALGFGTSSSKGFGS